MNERLHYPTPEQLLAMERAARRMRAQVVAGLFADGARVLTRWIARGISPRTGVKHNPRGKRRDLTIAHLGSES